jgi:hypothetical protein
VEKLYRLRRQRDVVLRPGQQQPQPATPLAANNSPATPPENAADATAEESASINSASAETESAQAAAIETWSDDPQLRRAVNHLQEKIETKDVALRKE